MFAHSAYLLFTQILSLGEKPFSNRKMVRKPFENIFQSELCFSESREIILTNERPGPVPDLPFIKGLGSVCLNTRSMGPRNPHRREMPHLLTGMEKYWDPKEKIYLIDEYNLAGWEDKVFGYDFLLQDQRMNFINYEISKKKKITAYDGNKRMASGSIFLHIYPAGYVVILLSISLLPVCLVSMNNFTQSLKECSPNNKGGKWVWKGFEDNSSLNSILLALKNNIFKSILASPNLSMKAGEWNTSIQLISPINPDIIGKVLIKGDFEYFDLRSGKGRGSEFILGNSQGFVYVFSSERLRKNTKTLFWRFFKLYEYAIFKKHIFEEYRDFLSKEIPRLKEYRLSTKTKLLEEDLLTFNVYDKDISRYMLALESYCSSVRPYLRPYFRRIYSFYAKCIHLYEKKESVNTLLSQWEVEVGGWDPPFVLLWKKVISPLKLIFGK